MDKVWACEDLIHDRIPAGDRTTMSQLRSIINESEKVISQADILVAAAATVATIVDPFCMASFLPLSGPTLFASPVYAFVRQVRQIYKKSNANEM